MTDKGRPIAMPAAADLHACNSWESDNCNQLIEQLSLSGYTGAANCTVNQECTCHGEYICSQLGTMNCAGGTSIWGYGMKCPTGTSVRLGTEEPDESDCMIPSDLNFCMGPNKSPCFTISQLFWRSNSADADCFFNPLPED